MLSRRERAGFKRTEKDFKLTPSRNEGGKKGEGPA